MGIKPQNANFVNHGNPWFIRGGNWNNGSDTGVFAFNNNNGHANSNISFRAVLSDYDMYLSLSYLCLRMQVKGVYHRGLIPVRKDKHINSNVELVGK